MQKPKKPKKVHILKPNKSLSGSKFGMKIVLKTKPKTQVTLEDVVHQQFPKYRARETYSRLKHEFLQETEYNKFLRFYNEVLLIMGQNKEQISVNYPILFKF